MMMSPCRVRACTVTSASGALVLSATELRAVLVPASGRLGGQLTVGEVDLGLAGDLGVLPARRVAGSTWR
jgi:hypothetical protein